MQYYRCPWAFENPQTGLLKTRDVVEGVPFTDTSYCQYGFHQRKATRIWHGLGDYLKLRPVCSSQAPWDVFKVLNKRKESAQGAPAKSNGERAKQDSFSPNQLHSTPPHLCDDIAEAVDIV